LGWAKRERKKRKGERREKDRCNPTFTVSNWSKSARSNWTFFKNRRETLDDFELKTGRSSQKTRPPATRGGGATGKRRFLEPEGGSHKKL